MRYLILGALIGLLIAFPALAVAVLVVATAAVSQPLVVAFGLGLAAGLKSRRLRRWAA